MEILIGAIIAALLYGVDTYNKYEKVAATNRAQAMQNQGIPINIMEIRKWTSSANTIWVKVPDLRPFAPHQVCTIIDINGTDFAGKYMVHDVWKDFPTEDPRKTKNQVWWGFALSGIGYWWLIESTPFAHTLQPGVLKLEAIPASTNLPNHNEDGGRAQIFGGTELKAGENLKASIVQIQQQAIDFITGPDAWKYGAAILALLLIITIITTEK